MKKSAGGIALMMLVAVLVVALSGCVSKTQSPTMKEFDRIVEIRDQASQRYSACMDAVRSNPRDADFWAKTVGASNDPRKLQLVTNTKSISKAYRQKAQVVADDWLICETGAISWAKQINQGYARAMETGTAYITAVYVEVITGKFKTYGEFNQSLLAAMQQADQALQVAWDQTIDELIAIRKAEYEAGRQSRNAAVMMLGGASGSQQGAQNNQNANQGQRTTNCRYIGSILNCVTN